MSIIDDNFIAWWNSLPCDERRARRRRSDRRRQFWMRERLRVLFGLLGVLALVACAQPASAQITWSGPRLTPQEAADVLRQAPGLANLTGVGTRQEPTGPTVFVMGGRPGAASWLDFPAPTPAQRLDGTLLDRPVTVYGLPSWWVVGQNGPLFERRRDHEHRGIAPVHR